VPESAIAESASATRWERLMRKTIQRILIMDEEPQIVKAMARHLKRKGFSVDSAGNGLEARDKILRNLKEGAPFDLLVTDLIFPYQEDFSLIAWVHETSPSMPVLVVSGLEDPEMIKEMVRGGMDEFCSKPLSHEIILQKIDMMDKRLQ
jgi:DNA-binding response OmpR family regulator